MKVYMLCISMELFDQKIFNIVNIEKNVEDPIFDDRQILNINNGENVFVWKYFEDQKTIDIKYINSIKKLQKSRGIENFPEDWEDLYKEVWARAEINYPEILV